MYEYKDYCVLSKYLISKFGNCVKYDPTEDNNNCPTPLNDTLMYLSEHQNEVKLDPTCILLQSINGFVPNQLLLYCVIDKNNNIKYKQNGCNYDYPKPLLDVCERFIKTALLSVVETPWFESRRVYLRICTSMIQKLENEKVINTKDKFKIIDTFLQLFNTVEYEVMTEGLPF